MRNDYWVEHPLAIAVAGLVLWVLFRAAALWIGRKLFVTRGDPEP